MKFVFRYSDRFLKAVAKLFSEEDLMALELELIENPSKGDVIPGGGGIRKLRFKAKGKGVRGGARVIYVIIVDAERITFLDAYAKNEKTDLSKDELKELKKTIEDEEPDKA